MKKSNKISQLALTAMIRASKTARNKMKIKNPISIKQLKIGEFFTLGSFTGEKKTIYISDGRFQEEINAELAIDIITFLVKEFEFKV